MGRLKTFLCLASISATIGAPFQPAAAESRIYEIYLSKDFVGNDWRQQMERVAEVSIKKGPLQGRVDLKIKSRPTGIFRSTAISSPPIRTTPSSARAPSCSA